MSTLDLTTALGRLLSDRDLRRAFLRDRAGAARTLGLRDADRAAFMALDAEALESQARALISKRFHEARNLLPATFERLGARAHELFIEYAQSQWPEGHRRHVLDAVQFCKYLKNHRQEFCPSEFNRARFKLGSRKFAMHWVCDAAAARRRSVQILYGERNGAAREVTLYVGLT